jgi:small-conductance mechanosensitive channel
VYLGILARFRERQIEIPYPQREVRLLPASS